MAYYDCTLINSHDSESVSKIQVPDKCLNVLIEIAMVVRL